MGDPRTHRGRAAQCTAVSLGCTCCRQRAMRGRDGNGEEVGMGMRWGMRWMLCPTALTPPHSPVVAAITTWHALPRLVPLPAARIQAGAVLRGHAGCACCIQQRAVGAVTAGLAVPRAVLPWGHGPGERWGHDEGMGWDNEGLPLTEMSSQERGQGGPQWLNTDPGTVVQSGAVFWGMDHQHRTISHHHPRHLPSPLSALGTHGGRAAGCRDAPGAVALHRAPRDVQSRSGTGAGGPVHRRLSTHSRVSRGSRAHPLPQAWGVSMSPPIALAWG